MEKHLKDRCHEFTQPGRHLGSLPPKRHLAQGWARMERMRGQRKDGLGEGVGRHLAAHRQSRDSPDLHRRNLSPGFGLRYVLYSTVRRDEGPAGDTEHFSQQMHPSVCHPYETVWQSKPTESFQALLASRIVIYESTTAERARGSIRGRRVQYIL